MAADAGGSVGVMARGGYYDLHSRTQGSATSIGVAEIEAAAAALELPAGPVRVADLGCAQGNNSLVPVRAAVEQLQARGAAAIDVVHTDLPTNDWATLFAVIENDPASYLVGHDDVHPFTVGRSFYRSLFPPATLHLGWASSALHWLSAVPSTVRDHFFVQLSTDADAQAAFRARSADDWVTFLRHRASELAVTGSVVIVDVLMDDDGCMGSEALFGALEDALRAARADARITDTEYEAMVYPTWFRSLDEMRAPFTPTFVGAAGAQLELVDLEPHLLADPFWSAYEADGDAAAYGAAQAGFLQGFLEPSFRSVLHRSTADQDRILTSVFADASRRIAADPQAVSPSYRLVRARVQRVA